MSVDCGGTLSGTLGEPTVGYLSRINHLGDYPVVVRMALDTSKTVFTLGKK